MIKRIAKAAAVGVATLGLLATSTPAQADQGVMVFTGSATTDALNYPVLGNARVNGSWTFTFGGVGVGAQAGVGAGSGNASGTASLDAGAVQALLPAPFNAGAYCGMSGADFTGTGSMSSSGNLGNSKTWLRRVGWRQSVASLIVFEGQGADELSPNNTTDNPGPYNRTLVGVVTAVPDALGGQSCTGAGATSFLVAGAAALV